jgi:uncharacterized protein (TIGR00251 family)
VTELALEAHPEGVVLRVRASPGARKERVLGVHGGALKIAVAAPPEKGRANDAIAALLAKELGLPARGIYLLSGATAKDKRFVVTAITAAELRRRLDALLRP